MDITDLIKPIDTTETELYRLYYGFSHDLNNANQITIDFFKIVRVGNKYKLLDCACKFYSDQRLKYIKKTFEDVTDLIVGSTNEFNSLQDIEKYITSLWHLNINERTYNKYKQFDYMFNVNVFKSKLKNRINYMLKTVDEVEMTFNNFERAIINQINKDYSRVAEIKKLEDNENFVTYRYKKYKFKKYRGANDEKKKFY